MKWTVEKVESIITYHLGNYTMKQVIFGKGEIANGYNYTSRGV